MGSWDIWVWFPASPQEKAVAKEGVLCRGSIPSVVGCVNGTLIAIKAPQGNAAYKSAFWSRKDYYALNTIIVSTLCSPFLTAYLAANSGLNSGSSQLSLWCALSQVCDSNMKIITSTPAARDRITTHFHGGILGCARRWSKASWKIGNFFWVSSKKAPPQLQISSYRTCVEAAKTRQGSSLMKAHYNAIQKPRVNCRRSVHCCRRNRTRTSFVKMHISCRRNQDSSL